MKKITIGIPRAFHYYRYGVLWKTFFNKLGCTVILSPKTNHSIIKTGLDNSPKECCLSYKIYIGHALTLKDKCDYLFIPQICNYGESSKVCEQHLLAYEYLKVNTIKEELLTYNISHTSYKYQLLGLFKIAMKITKNPIKIIYSYIIAKKRQINYDASKENENKNKLNKNTKKVLLVSQFYNLQDEYLINNIIEYLEKNNLTPILATSLNNKFSLYYKNFIPWKYFQELLGTIYYYQYQVDGIISITPNQCKFTQLFKEYTGDFKIPILYYNLKGDNSKTILETELEPFIDIIKYNKKDF